MVVSSVSSLGQKAANLLRLSRQFPDLVPRFTVVELTEFFSGWENMLSSLDSLAVSFVHGRLTEQAYERRTKTILRSLTVRSGIINDIRKETGQWKTQKVSYRTSAVAEDMDDSSFAGQYVSFVDEDTHAETVERCFRGCAGSLFSSRVVRYLAARKYPLHCRGGSVIIQKMFYGCASGVLFSENGHNQLEFAYTPHWKNTAVEGTAARRYTIPKDEVDTALQLPADLPRTIGEIIRTALVLERQEGKPLDIEWAADDTRAALLQYRPVTVTQLEYVLEWDNSNIAESYPGITLPLTYSFIRRLYARVYPEFLQLLGNSPDQLSSQRLLFENMLGYIRGRVYYNINRWYELVRLLPGYRYNKEFFEAMLMPVKKRPQEKQVHRTWRQMLSLGIAAVRFFWLLLQTDRLSEIFIRRYMSRYERYRAVLWDHLTAADILGTLAVIERDLLRQWAVPILNDFRTMVFHGMLRKFFFPRANDDRYVAVLHGIQDMKSIEPLRRLESLTENIRSALLHQTDSPEKLADAIQQRQEYQDLRSRIREYLNEFGGRSPDELKLENPRLGEDMMQFVLFLLTTASHADGESKRLQSVKHPAAVSVPTTNLLMRWVFSFVLSQTKQGISRRERFRFYRAQVFGIARRAYLAVGSRLAAAGLLRHRDDVFYLTRDEIHDLVFGHAPSYETKHIVRRRQTQFAAYATENPGRRVVSVGIISPLHPQEDGSLHPAAKTTLRGLGVSGGTVTGTAIVMETFDPRADVHGKVIVTGHTDPGWTLLFLHAAAVVVERGNALSHAAIVARELGIPAVVAVEEACTVLKTNDRLIVNGNTGEVTVV